MTTSAVSLKHKIAQKIMLDFRYFDDGSSHSCSKSPVLELPSALADLIADTCLGGVILFKENLADLNQISDLTSQLQDASKRSALGLPLFISTDHEGGRVTRLPEQLATNLTGNMSIGATYKHHGIRFATLTGQILSKELAALGINVNHAPVVDINTDAHNPVINVRAFGDDPIIAGTLAAAQTNAQQENCIIASLKHFPGHGNTHVDSHTGLPCVNQAAAIIEESDLVAFSVALSESTPEMVMTAHVQYPALDNSRLITKTGESIIAPATMSRKIIYDILRVKMNYKGLIITDALDMSGISDFFDPTTAVKNSFAAGIDIALMPLRIRTKQDIAKLPDLIDYLACAAQEGILDAGEINASYQRICDVKEKYSPEKCTSTEPSIVGCEDHIAIEKELALEAITLVKGENNRLANILGTQPHLQIIMPQKIMGLAMLNALAHNFSPSAKLDVSDINAESLANTKRQIQDTNIIVAGNMYPTQSPVELGGIEDAAELNKLVSDQQFYKGNLLELLQYARNLNKTIVFISLRAPYDVTDFLDLSDFALACYSYNVVESNGEMTGPAFSAIAKILTGQAECKGTLPVKLNQ